MKREKIYKKVVEIAKGHSETKPLVLNELSNVNIVLEECDQHSALEEALMLVISHVGPEGYRERYRDDNKYTFEERQLCFEYLLSRLKNEMERRKAIPKRNVEPLEIEIVKYEAGWGL